jgi:hypothetical protein
LGGKEDEFFEYLCLCGSLGVSVGVWYRFNACSGELVHFIYCGYAMHPYPINNVSWFVHLWETWLGNNDSWFVQPLETWLENNVSRFAELRETWLGNNVSWFVQLLETWLGNNVSWFVRFLHFTWWN